MLNKLKNYQLLIGLGLGLLWLFFSVSTSQAQTILFQDNFDDGEFADWQVARSMQWQNPDQVCLLDDQPAVWEIANGQLGITLDSPGCVTELVPTDLDLSTERAFRYEFDWQFKESARMDRNVIIKWQDPDNWYALKILRDQILLQKKIDGQSSPQYNNWGYYPFVADETYHFRIEVVDNLITLWVEDQQIFQCIDHFPQLTSSYTIGLKASVGAIKRSASYFDNLVVTSLTNEAEKRLGLSIFKQTDPEWTDEEYDHAQDWAENPTLGRWGCALSSAAMILRYYGISHLPNGRQLNPSRLNRWLKTEVDGYVGQGLLNWLAISRLSQLMSEQLKTPVLEYSRLSHPQTSQVIEQLQKRQPVILQIPGHFLVSDGYQTQTQQLLIKDPAYDYQRFSQHQSQLLSAGLYQPSQTDLSYLLVVTQPGVKLTLFNQTGQVVSSFQTFREYLQDPNSPYQAGNQITQLSTLAKPTNGRYQLRVIPPTPTSQTLLEFYLYDQEGQVESYDYQQTGPSLLTIDYQPSVTSKIQPASNKFGLFRTWLAQYRQSQELRTFYVYHILDFLAQQAQKQTEQLNQQRYYQLLHTKLKQFEVFIKDEARQQLLLILDDTDTTTN